MRIIACIVCSMMTTVMPSRRRRTSTSSTSSHSSRPSPASVSSSSSNRGEPGQRPRKLHQPKLLVGQPLGGDTGLIGQSDTLQCLRGRGDRSVIREAGAVRSDDDIVQQRQAGEAANHLEGAADAQPADLMDFLAEHGFAVERCVPSVGGRTPLEHIEQCGFAGAVGADDADDLARADRRN